MSRAEGKLLDHMHALRNVVDDFAGNDWCHEMMDMRARQDGSERPIMNMHSELPHGVEVSKSSLKDLEVGWSFQGIPVMVFKLDLLPMHHDTASTNVDVHLRNCSVLKKSNHQTLWAINDARAFSEWGGVELTVCPHCLELSGYQGFDSHSAADPLLVQNGFTFEHYVQEHSGAYFPDWSAVCWSPSEVPKPLVFGENSQALQCVHCAWQLSAESPYLITESIFGVAAPVCLCCLDKAPFTCGVPESLVVKAYAERFWDWKQSHIEARQLSTIESQSLVFSWDQVRPHFPLRWQALIAVLEDFESANIYCGVEQGFALMAWTRLRRAIVLEEWGKGGFPNGWEVWTYDEVLGHL